MTITTISWGCGVQSTTLAVMSALGYLPKVDAVITSDTQWESNRTYEHRDFYTRWLTAHGIPVYITTGGNIRQLGAEEHIHIPFWTQDGGPLHRQCTYNFKIQPIRRLIRTVFDLPNIPAPGTVEQWIGFSLDEWQRMKPSRVKFIKNTWPLIDKRMSRNDCIDLLQSHGLPVPIKSACLGCPYRQPTEWLAMNNAELSDVISFDEENRHNPLVGCGSTTSALYVYKYRRVVPLRDADLEHDAHHERTARQLPLMICEEGYCHV